MGRNRKKQVFSECPLCGRRVLPSRWKSVSQESEKQIFHMTCPGCKVSALGYFWKHEKGFSGIESITDLGADEAAEKLNMETITADEVIEVYKSL